jgi:ACR3 family arsenite efflux pump ArsB
MPSTYKTIHVKKKKKKLIRQFVLLVDNSTLLVFLLFLIFLFNLNGKLTIPTKDKVLSLNSHFSLNNLQNTSITKLTQNVLDYNTTKGLTNKN